MFHTSKFDSLSIMSVQWFISELWHWGVFWQACKGLMICCWALTCNLALSQLVCILSQGWSLMAVHDWEVAKFYLIIGGNQCCVVAEACWPAAELHVFWTIIDIPRLSLFLENTQCYIVDYWPNFETSIIDTYYPGKIQRGCSSCTPSACIFNRCPSMPCGKILELWLRIFFRLAAYNQSQQCWRKTESSLCRDLLFSILQLGQKISLPNNFLQHNSLVYHILLTIHHKYMKNIAPFSTSIPIQCLTLGTFVIPIQIFCPKYLLRHFLFFFSFSWKSKTIYHLLVMWR